MSVPDEVAIPMTRAEREELKALNRQRARVAKASIEQRKAELLADIEEQLAAIYGANDEAWQDLAEEAERLVRALDAQLAERCRERGIQPEFRPRLDCNWYGRGVNGDRHRRAELRKVAERRIQAEGRAAKVALDEAALAIATDLATAALTTAAARRFLEAMPSVSELMPTIDVGELGAGE